MKWKDDSISLSKLEMLVAIFSFFGGEVFIYYVNFIVMKKLTIVIALMALLPFAYNAYSAVFAEVASASYCPDCPPANKLLFEIYNEHEYPFYYVTMVGDKNEFAYDRIKNDYNFYWYPTVFIDGGYEVVLEATKEAYIKAIERSMEREKPDVKMSLDVSWGECPCQHGLFMEIKIQNNETKPYSGNLKVYVVEINSRWKDYEANQYHFAFLEFAYDENITLSPKEEKYVYAIWDPTLHFPDIDRDDVNNLAVFAVLFNSTWHINYANPPDKNPFKAYYVDSLAAHIPENSPPSIAITSPKQNYLYIFDREIMRFPATVIIGSKTVKINAYDESGIDRVEIYVDGVLQTTLEENYSWVWKGFGRHNLRAIAYDNNGLNATDSLSAYLI